jgi:uncharacterized membrane protein
MTEMMPYWRQRRHSPFYAAGVSGLALLPVLWLLARHLAIEISTIVFFLVYLGLMALRIPKLTVARLKTSGERDNAPAYVILLVTLLAVVTVVATLFNALNRDAHPSVFEVSIAFLSVIAGWLTIHTMFASHYAHHYWRRIRQEDGTLAAQCGLEFPQTAEPGGYDFLYFSLVIGMTAQTSDVVITTTAMRRINLGHAVLSFFFNTVLVAAAVNAVVSLAG